MRYLLSPTVKEEYFMNKPDTTLQVQILNNGKLIAATKSYFLDQLCEIGSFPYDLSNTAVI